MHHTESDEHEHFTDAEIQEFYADVCRAIDKHADNTEEQYELIDSLPFFTHEWMEHYGVTMTFWSLPNNDE